MGTITPPKAHIPIGTVVIGGVSLDIQPHPELVRFFQTLVDRVGGTTGASTTDLTLSQFEDAGIEEGKAEMYALRDEFRSAPAAVFASQADDPDGRVESLEAQLHAALQRIEALEQGQMS